jgi:hypothetical protein
MPDQIIDAVMARGLHADACRAHALVGWVVLQDTPEYPDKLAWFKAWSHGEAGLALPG